MVKIKKGHFKLKKLIVQNSDVHSFQNDINQIHTVLSKTVLSKTVLSKRTISHVLNDSVRKNNKKLFFTREQSTNG